MLREYTTTHVLSTCACMTLPRSAHLSRLRGSPCRFPSSAASRQTFASCPPSSPRTQSSPLASQSRSIHLAPVLATLSPPPALSSPRLRRHSLPAPTPDQPRSIHPPQLPSSPSDAALLHSLSELSLAKSTIACATCAPLRAIHRHVVALPLSMRVSDLPVYIQIAKAYLLGQSGCTRSLPSLTAAPHPLCTQAACMAYSSRTL